MSHTSCRDLEVSLRDVLLCGEHSQTNQLRTGCEPEMCIDERPEGYVIKSISLERAHFKADVTCDEANGALASEGFRWMEHHGHLTNMRS